MASTPVPALTCIIYSAVPGTLSASRMMRPNDRSSDRALCTSAMFSNPVRPSRISLPYMCMTMSLSSAWITPRPRWAARTWNTSQMSPNPTMRPRRLGVMSVVKILTVGCPAWIDSANWPNSSVGSAPSTMVWKA